MASADQAACTVDELNAIITAPSGGFYMMPCQDYNEVYDGIYIGDSSSAMNRPRLQRLGMTHVLNMAKGPDDGYHINTNAAFYQDVGIDYKAVEATDMMNCKLDKYFEETADYIESAVSSGGKILVHCKEGVSRSATAVLAFLMMKRHLTAQEATRLVRQQREIGPNDGFLQQLCDLNEKLTAVGHFRKKFDDPR